jgi:hypothetical protein
MHVWHAMAKAAVYEVSGQAPFRHLIAFSGNARTVRADDRASCPRLLACSALAFLPHRSPLTRDWGRAAGEKECPSRRRLHARPVAGETHRVGWRLARPEQFARTTVYPCDACHGATTPYLVRSQRTGRPIKSLPIERTVSSRITRRLNGDSLRLAFATADRGGHVAIFSSLTLQARIGQLTPLHRLLASRDGEPWNSRSNANLSGRLPRAAHPGP